MGVPDHHFNPELARDYGVDTAIFLHNIYHWIKHNESNGKNFYEGRYWTFNSLSAFCKIYPYWSRRQIERIVSACKSGGLLLTSNFNEDRRDRTTWYTLSDRGLRYFSNSIDEAVECPSPNGDMQSREAGQTCHDSVTTIPYNRPYNRQTDDSPYSPSERGKGKKRSSKYDLAEDAKPLLRAYCGEDRELHQALGRFIELRTTLRAVNSKAGISALLTKLDKLSGGDRALKLDMIQESMANSWKSVFPLRGSRAAPAGDGRVVETEVTYPL